MNLMPAKYLLRGQLSKLLCYQQFKVCQDRRRSFHTTYRLSPLHLRIGEGILDDRPKKLWRCPLSNNVQNSNSLQLPERRFVRDRQLLSRRLHTSTVAFHGEYEWQDPKSEDEVVQVEVTDKEGKAYNIRGKVGDNLLYLAKRFEVEMEGACEASLACTTCHVYVDHDYSELLPEATETEEDLLDQAPFLKENSRLGCQIILTKELNGIKLKLPAATKNFYVDGHKPTPH